MQIDTPKWKLQERRDDRRPFSNAIGSAMHELFKQVTVLHLKADGINIEDKMQGGCPDC
ncbi:hypothetical protein D3C85_1822190 [compost metagenome]